MAINRSAGGDPEDPKEDEEGITGGSLAEIVQEARVRAQQRYTDGDENDIDRTYLCMPIFYRNLFKRSKGCFREYYMHMDFLENNLQIDKSSSNVAGERWLEYSGHFLCAEVQDEDLPWDVIETEW